MPARRAVPRASLAVWDGCWSWLCSVPPPAWSLRRDRGTQHGSGPKGQVNPSAPQGRGAAVSQPMRGECWYSPSKAASAGCSWSGPKPLLNAQCSLNSQFLIGFWVGFFVFVLFVNPLLKLGLPALVSESPANTHPSPSHPRLLLRGSGMFPT